MTDMTEITRLCRAYADARDELAEVSEDIRERRRAAVKSRLRALQARVAEVAQAKDTLREAIASAPDLFVSPRTRALEGIRVGYRKQPGRVECDEVRVIAAIRKKRPAQAASLVRVKERLNKSALLQLDSKTLAALGVGVSDVDDEIVIKTAGTDLDKLVDALLADSEEEARHE